VVRPCDALGKAGVWEDITPKPLINLGYPAGAILVDPHDPAIVYAGSGEGGGLFKSKDCGATWTHINTGQNGADFDTGRLWDMVIDPTDSQTLYSVNGYGKNGVWRTKNGGVDWVNTTPDSGNVGQHTSANFASIIGMDVTNPKHLVVTYHSGCNGEYGPNCQTETTDGGDTWRIFKTASGGGEGGGVVVLNATTWAVGAYQAFWLTTDSGATWTKASGASAHYQLYQSGGTFYLGTMSGILKSTDGKNWSLLPGFTEAVQGLTGYGKSLFAGQQFGNRYFRIPENDPSKFTELPNPDGNKDGGYFMAYDGDHHLLYSAEIPDGFWRMVVP